MSCQGKQNQLYKKMSSWKKGLLKSRHIEKNFNDKLTTTTNDSGAAYQNLDFTKNPNEDYLSDYNK